MFGKFKRSGNAVILMLLALSVSGYFAWHEGYRCGYEKAQNEGLHLQKRQAEASQRALQDEMNRSQRQLIRIREHEEGYLARQAELTARSTALQRRIDDVTQQYVDEKGKTHPVACLFTRGFVQQYNAAIGVFTPDITTATGDAGITSVTAATSDARLRASAVSQRDILANLADNGQRCQQLSEQVRGLQAYIKEVSQ